MLRYSLILIIILFGCKTKKEVAKIEIKETIQAKESANWIKTENMFSKIDGTAKIEFEGLSEVVIDYHGNISMKGNNATIATTSSRTDTIFRSDTIYMAREVAQVNEVKSKEIKKERTSIPFWVYAVLFLAVAVFLIWRFLK